MRTWQPCVPQSLPSPPAALAAFLVTCLFCCGRRFLQKKRTTAAAATTEDRGRKKRKKVLGGGGGGGGGDGGGGGGGKVDLKVRFDSLMYYRTVMYYECGKHSSRSTRSLRILCNYALTIITTMRSCYVVRSTSRTGCSYAKKVS